MKIYKLKQNGLYYVDFKIDNRPFHIQGWTRQGALIRALNFYKHLNELK